jgi:membrane-associated HD superfamily phosphohydrolase
MSGSSPVSNGPDLGFLRDVFSQGVSEKHHQQDMAQSDKLHKEEMEKADDHHLKEMRQAQQHQFREIKNDMKQHMEQVGVDLREASKECDRDSWEQRHSMFETLITSAAVMLGGETSIIVEGLASLPGEGIAENENFQFWFCLLLGLSYGLLFMCILLAMVVVKRMSQFMQKKSEVQRQQIGEVYSNHLHLQDKLANSELQKRLADDVSPRELKEQVQECEQLLDLFTNATAPQQADDLVWSQTKHLAQSWADMHENLAKQICITTGPSSSNFSATYMNFTGFYTDKCQSLGDWCGACFIAGIVSTLIVLLLVFIAHFR